MSRFDHVLYHHINVNDDRDAGLANSKKFLDLYYTANYSKERLEAWLTYGSPRDCIEHLKRYKEAAATASRSGSRPWAIRWRSSGG